MAICALTATGDRRTAYMLGSVVFLVSRHALQCPAMPCCVLPCRPMPCCSGPTAVFLCSTALPYYMYGCVLVRVAVTLVSSPSRHIQLSCADMCCSSSLQMAAHWHISIKVPNATRGLKPCSAARPKATETQRPAPAKGSKGKAMQGMQGTHFVI